MIFESKFRLFVDGIRNALVILGVLFGLGQEVYADITVAYTDTVTTNQASAITGTPSQGLDGRDGRTGYYGCNSSMQWGEACVNWYSFGDYTVANPKNGYNAPSSGTFTTVAADTNDVSAVDYDAASLSTNGFTVQVGILSNIKKL